MKIFFRYLLTGKDNKTYEIARFLLFIGFISLIVFTAYDVFVLKHFDPLNFCTGLAGLLFGGSGGIAVKAHTEPRNKNDRS
jgi:hypothetical protein